MKEDRERFRKSKLKVMEEFKGKIKVLTGLDWENRFDQPVQSKYTFIKSNYHYYSTFSNAQSKPL